MVVPTDAWVMEINFLKVSGISKRSILVTCNKLVVFYETWRGIDVYYFYISGVVTRVIK